MLYVTGGSSGAHALNRLIGNSLPKLLSYWVVIHQTGDTKLTGDYEHLQQIRGELSTDRKERYIIKKFTATDEIGWIYKNADIVVGRAGVNTVLELMATRTKALLFPLAAGQKDEQLKNAKMYAESGLGEYLTHIPQSNEFVSHLKKLSQKAKKSVKLDTIHKEAAAKIADIVIKTYEKKRKEAA